MIQYISNDHKEKMNAFIWDGTIGCVRSNVPKRDWHMFRIAKNHQLEITNKPSMVIYANSGELIMQVMKDYYFDAPKKLLNKYHRVSKSVSQKQSNHGNSHKKSTHLGQESLF